MSEQDTKKRNIAVRRQKLEADLRFIAEESGGRLLYAPLTEYENWLFKDWLFEDCPLESWPLLRVADTRALQIVDVAAALRNNLYALDCACQRMPVNSHLSDELPLNRKWKDISRHLISYANVEQIYEGKASDELRFKDAAGSFACISLYRDAAEHKLRFPLSLNRLLGLHDELGEVKYVLRAAFKSVDSDPKEKGLCAWLLLPGGTVSIDNKQAAAMQKVGKVQKKKILRHEMRRMVNAAKGLPHEIQNLENTDKWIQELLGLTGNTSNVTKVMKDFYNRGEFSAIERRSLPTCLDSRWQWLGGQALDEVVQHFKATREWDIPRDLMNNLAYFLEEFYSEEGCTTREDRIVHTILYDDDRRFIPCPGLDIRRRWGRPLQVKNGTAYILSWRVRDMKDRWCFMHYLIGNFLELPGEFQWGSFVRSDLEETFHKLGIADLYRIIFQHEEECLNLLYQTNNEAPAEEEESVYQPLYYFVLKSYLFGRESSYFDRIEEEIYDYLEDNPDPGGYKAEVYHAWQAAQPAKHSAWTTQEIPATGEEETAETQEYRDCLDQVMDWLFQHGNVKKVSVRDTSMKEWINQELGVVKVELPELETWAARAQKIRIVMQKQFADGEEVARFYEGDDSFADRDRPAHERALACGGEDTSAARSCDSVRLFLKDMMDRSLNFRCVYIRNRQDILAWDGQKNITFLLEPNLCYRR